MKTDDNATLISEIATSHTPPPLAGVEADIINDFYKLYGVSGKGPLEKNQAIQKAIKSRSFYAFGGSETAEMELRANERIYLRQHGR